MAQNDLKPHHSSSEEEDDEEEEEEEEASGSEDEQTSGSETDEVSDSASEEKPNPPEPTKPIIAPPKSAIKPQAPDSSESGTEESGSSDTDSDSPPKKSPLADPKIKPISSKPMDREAPTLDSKAAKKSGSKTSSTPPPTSKRPSVAPAASEKDPKKSRTNTAVDDDSKKQLFQRLWSEDDEIVILKGMIDYKTETGENPIADTAAFHEFIKKSLHVDVSRAQLVDKIRRLRKKFVNNASREKNGKDRSFSKSHEQKGYELSKLIWGGSSHSSGTESKKAKSQNQKNGNGASTSGGTAAAAAAAAATLSKSNGLDEKEVALMEVEKNMDISRFVRYGGRDDSPVLTEEIVKAGMELVEGPKRVELEDKWKSLKKQELELYLKKMELIKEQALIVLEAVNSSGN